MCLVSTLPNVEFVLRIITGFKQPVHQNALGTSWVSRSKGSITAPIWSTVPRGTRDRIIALLGTSHTIIREGIKLFLQNVQFMKTDWMDATTTVLVSTKSLAPIEGAASFGALPKDRIGQIRYLRQPRGRHSLLFRHGKHKAKQPTQKQ